MRSPREKMSAPNAGPGCLFCLSCSPCQAQTFLPRLTFFAHNVQVEDIDQFQQNCCDSSWPQGALVCPTGSLCRDVSSTMQCIVDAGIDSSSALNISIPTNN